MRSARGWRKTWRAARQAAEQVRDGSRVGETRRGDGGEDRRRREEREKDRRSSRSSSGSTSSSATERGPTESPSMPCSSIYIRRFALRCTMSMPLQFERSPTYISTSTSEMSQGLCNDSWKVLIDVISKSCQELFTIVKALETECSRLLGWISILLAVGSSNTTRGGWLVE